MKNICKLLKDKLPHIHFFTYHHQLGINVYTQCRCGKRDWYSLHGGYSPLDKEWLDNEKKNENFS